jgi:hypothetical protein
LAVEQEQYFRNDELKIYRGEDFVVSKHIIIHQPTLGQIADYGERDYWSLVYNFTATPQSMKVQLWDMQPSIDYTEITPYQLFYMMLYRIYPQEKTSILFGDLDFSKFQVMQRQDDESILLYQEVVVGDIYNHDNELLFHFNNLYEAERFIGYEKDTLFDELIRNNGIFEDYIFSNLEKESITIDEYTYGVIIDYLCKSHFIEQDLKIPANNSTKMVLIEDARDELERNKNKEYHSQLKNLISTMINSEGFKYNHSQVWDMKINAFMDSVKRIGKIKNADLLMQSGYSGFGVNLKGIDKKQLDWLGELE